MNQNRIAIVVPTHIMPSKAWIVALEREAAIGHADVIIVDGSGTGLTTLPPEWKVYHNERQQAFLGELYEYFDKTFHGMSACRVFGHIVAYKENYDVIIGLDNDCIVPFNFVEDHLKMLNTNMNGGWINPLGGSGLYSRGYPYSMRNWKTVANMGLWENVLDINGKDRKPNELRRTSSLKHFNAPAPIPFSGMNWAITREAIFGYLFLPNFDFKELQEVSIMPGTGNGFEPGFKDWKFRRIDDIWGGYIFQQILRKVRMGVTYGPPVIFHDTTVIAEEDVRDEEAMYHFEDDFVKLIDAEIEHATANANKLDVNSLMISLAHSFRTSAAANNGPFKALIPVIDWWSKVIIKYS